MLFNIIVTNEIYVKAQVQIVQNIQIWLPMKNNRWGKNLIQENTKGKNFKEGHMSRNYRILLFFSKLQRRQTHARTKGIGHNPLPQEEKN